MESKGWHAVLDPGTDRFRILKELMKPFFLHLGAFPINDRGHLSRILGDVANGILFDSLDVVAERGVVLSEWRDGLGAGERVRTKQFPVIFRGSRYAKRIPIGDPKRLETANPSALKRFWRDWYRPDLMSVIAVGDADPDKLEGLIKSTFAPVAKRVNARVRTVSAEDEARILRRRAGLASLSCVAMDCVEVAPAYDHAELTSHAAATLVWTYLCGQIAKAAPGRSATNL